MGIEASPAWALVVAICFAQACHSQLSDPVALDRQVDVRSNKFLQRRAHNDDPVSTSNDEILASGSCDANLALMWMTEVSSSIYATPIIHDLYSDGHKDIIVTSFVHYLEVVDASSGAKATEDSWPAFHKSTVHASPLTYDFDFDNIQDILVASYDGEILAYKDTGELFAERLVIPRLKVHKDWYRGLAADFIDHSHPDVGGAPDAQEAAIAKEGGGIGHRLLASQDAPFSSSSENFDSAGFQPRRLLQENIGSISEDAAATFSELFGEAQGGAPGDAKASPSEEKAADEEQASVENMAGVEDLSWGDFPVDPDAHWRDGYGNHYAEYHVEPTLHDHAWADEMYFAAPHKEDKGFVFIDSHILCTPAIGDIDGDGRDELVVGASYFFDREYYDAPEHRAALGKDIDTAKYIAGGIVVFDLRTRQIKWTQHLDLSTDHTQFRAYIYSAPTLADIDRDGRLEIIIGTSMGFLYVLDYKGQTKEGWPLQMGEIQAQVAVADLLGDGSLVVVAADARGNVAAFDADAQELWERHLGTLIAQAPTFADVNDDGLLEVLLGGTNGAIHVLVGVSGQNAPNFPVYAQGRIMSPVLPTGVHPGQAIQLVVPSYDGHLYVVDSLTGCMDVVDIGETSYSMVLADDLDGNGFLDLLLATMNGNLYAFQTAAPANPLAVWPTQVPGRSSFTSRLRWLSVAATQETRQPRDVRGQVLSIRFEIRDPRAKAANATLGPYTVYVSLRGVGAKEMNAGSEPVIGVTDTFSQPGVYTVQVPCPRSRSTATVYLELHDRGGIVVTDNFSLSFHMHFHRLLKWILAGPFAIACLVILAQHAERLGLSLPSTQ